MSNVIVLGGKIGLGLLGTLVLVIVIFKSNLLGVSQRRFTSISVSSLAISRLAIFFMCFVFLNFTEQSDVWGHYYLEAKQALSGFLPYRDFISVYGPLFPYVISLPLRLWDSPKSIILFTIAVELLSYIVWLKVARRIFGEKISRRAALIYLCNPLPLINVAIIGQNQVMILFFLGLSIYFLLEKKDLISGLVFSLSLVAVKFLSVLFLPVIYWFATRRVRWLCGFIVLPLFLYGFLFVKHINFLQPVEYQHFLYTSGNIPFLLSLLGVDLSLPFLTYLFHAILLIILAATFLLNVRRCAKYNKKHLIYLATLVMLVFMMASKKAFTTYLLIFFFPLCVTVASYPPRTRSIVLFGLFGTIAAVEPSLWYRWMRQGQLFFIWQSPATSGMQLVQITLFLMIEIALIAYYIFYFGRTRRLLLLSGEK